MDRLTHNGNLGPYWDKSVFDSHAGMEEDLIIERLCAYENTGYSPSEFDVLCREMSDLRMALGFKTYDELRDAIRKQRVFTIPCSVGDSYFTMAKCCGAPKIEYLCDQFGGCDECQWTSYEIRECHFKSVVHILNSVPYFGRTIFLTREKAVAEAVKRGARCVL